MSDAKKYWESNPTAAARNQWTSHPIIGEEVYLRISGRQSPAHWLTWLFTDYFAGRQFERVLSAGCGCGEHEIAMARLDAALQIDAFDISETSIAIAHESARSEGLSINFFCDDLNAFVPESKQAYDLVLCTGSLHHVKELEVFLASVRDALRPDGYFVVNEYVGECYNIYSKSQVDLINRLLARIPDELLIRPGAQVHNPTIEAVMALDPSEAVRSALIPKFLPLYFNIEIERPFGGGLLHPLFPLLDSDALAKHALAENALLGLVLELESILMESGQLGSDFLFYVCRPKNVVA